MLYVFLGGAFTTINQDGNRCLKSKIQNDLALELHHFWESTPLPNCLWTLFTLPFTFIQILYFLQVSITDAGSYLRKWSVKPTDCLPITTDISDGYWEAPYITTAPYQRSCQLYWGIAQVLNVNLLMHIGSHLY